MKYRIKENFVVRHILDDNLVVPTGDAMAGFLGTIVLSETACYVWEQLQKDRTEEELVNCVLQEYAC